MVWDLERVLTQGWGSLMLGGREGGPRLAPRASHPFQPEVLPRPPVVASTPAPKAEPAIIPATRNEPIGLKASDFLPVSGSPV